MADMKTLRMALLTLATLLMLVVAAASPGFISPRIDVAQALDGSMSGTVTDESTSDPLSGIDVCAYEGPDWDGGESPVGCDTTDGSGAYSIGSLPEGDYLVKFQDPSGTYAFEWYNDKLSASSADLVAVIGGANTPGIDAALGPGGSISGTVTAEGSGTPLSGIDVCPERPGWRWDFWFACGVTDGSGDYTLGGLPTLDYNVEFRDSSGTYATEWYDDKPDHASADPVSVTGGANTPGIDAALGLGGSISGTVTNESPGDPLSDIEVCAHHERLVPAPPWNFMVQCDTTDGTGAYSLIGLRTGNYNVDFRDPAATYGFEWYNDKGSIGSGDLVAVTGGAGTAGIDAALPLAGSISGTVTEEGTGDPVPDASVCALGPGPPWDFWPGCITVDGSGAYSLIGLRPGDYVVAFGGAWSIPYVPEWYEDKWHSSTADPVSVTGGAETSGIDGTLIEDIPGLLKIGTLLPFHGGLEGFGPQLMRGAELAAKHLNAGGGVNGLPVVLVVEDSLTDATQGANAAQRLVDSGVQAIVGAVSSGVTVPVAEGVTIPNGVLLVSPSSTSPAITELADDDLVFRTTISDALQGLVLGQLAWDLGFGTACTMYLDNAYGQGLSSAFTQAFEALGGTVQVQVPHDDKPPGSSYLPELQTCTDGNPDVLAAISYPQQGGVYLNEALDHTLIDQFIFTDGLKYQPMFDELDVAHPDAFDGMYGTAPGTSLTAEFSSAYEAEYGEPPSLPFIAETYDAVVAIALAAGTAGSTDTAAIRDALRGVVCPPGSPIGAGAAAVADGLTLAAAAEHVDYEGGTDSQEFNEYGDSSRGIIQIWKTDETAHIVPDSEEPVAAEPDADGDGFDVCAEVYLGTDFLDDCPDDLSDDAWPLDVNMDTFVTVAGDALNLRGRIGACGGPPPDPNWLQRVDLNADNYITVAGDALPYRGMIGVTCTNP
jgi:branched-chain amino acid transport system substrate-binding protein